MLLRPIAAVPLNVDRDSEGARSQRTSRRVDFICGIHA